MKHIAYSLWILLLPFFAGCAEENLSGTNPNPLAGSEVAVRFTAAIPGYATVFTRASGGVGDMHLLIFDENGLFISRRTATLTNQTETGGDFTAMLPSSTKKRTVHFISNFDWSNFDDNAMLGVNEATVVGLMVTQNATFWSRKELSGGVFATTFNGVTVELLRNQAKISVVNEDSNFIYEGFVVHNMPDKGTVAPYNATNGFAEGALAEGAGMTLVAAQSAGISTDEKLLFERKNAGTSNITTVIVKGTYSGNPYFYKIDLIDADKNRYDLQRNYHYVVKIKTVIRAGYTNFDDALAGASHNNTALDPIIEKYPMISDGTSKLQVEKTLVILTKPNQAFSVWAKYFPDINSDAVDNTGVTAVLQPGSEALSGAVSLVGTTVSGTGLGTFPDESKEARIVVSKGDLARTIRVVLRKPFEFSPVSINNTSSAMLINGQSVDAVLRFNIPQDFPDDLFPLTINIYTQGLYPATSGLEMMVESGVIHYVYRATAKGEQTVKFKTNKSNNAETVKLTADYFRDGEVTYDVLTSVSGAITYGGNGSVPSGTAAPSGMVISASTGSISVSPAGQYIYTLPSSSNNSTPVTFTYRKQVNVNYKEEYTCATTIGNLINNPEISMNFNTLVFEGTIQYKRANGWRDVPATNNVSINTGPGTIKITSEGKYQYVVDAATPDATSIKFTYNRTSSSMYTQTKTIAELKSDSSLQLQ